MHVVLIVVAVIVVLVVVVVLVGYLLPKGHSASREATFPVSAERLFAVITTPADFPAWRSDVKRVEILPAEGGRAQHREFGSNGAIRFRELRSIPNRELVNEIADRDLPFGGRWTFVLTPAGAGSTTLRITEDGEIYNPVFRVVARFLIGYHKSLERYLADLGKRVGSSPPTTLRR